MIPNPEDDQWVYLPSLLPTQPRSGSQLGHGRASDLTELRGSIFTKQIFDPWTVVYIFQATAQAPVLSVLTVL